MKCRTLFECLVVCITAYSCDCSVVVQLHFGARFKFVQILITYHLHLFVLILSITYLLAGLSRESLFENQVFCHNENSQFPHFISIYIYTAG